MSKNANSSIKVETARGIVTDPKIRTAAAEVAPGVAKLGFKVGKRMAGRRTRKRLRHLEKQINSLVGLLGTYGPPIAQQLGVIERPRRKRLAPRITTGVAIGAGAMYLLEPGGGARHRQQVKQLVAGWTS